MTVVTLPRFAINIFCNHLDINLADFFRRHLYSLFGMNVINVEPKYYFELAKLISRY